MNFNRYANLVEATNDLNKRGFTHSFKMENGKMNCLESKTSYTPENMKVIELHRFEGYTNPADNSVAYAVECNDGKKGVIITPYGPYADHATDEFMRKVKVVPQGDDLNVTEINEETSRK